MVEVTRPMKRSIVEEESMPSSLRQGTIPCSYPQGTRLVAAVRAKPPISPATCIPFAASTLSVSGFRCGQGDLFGNLDGQSYDDLVVTSLRDPILSSVTRANGFIQIGRPEAGSYDPVCFDGRRRTKKGEAGIVRLDLAQYGSGMRG
jgi:hypothetical protein